MQQPTSGGGVSNLFALSAVERHEYILKTYVLNRNANSKHKRDIDVIKENHRFLWDDDEEVNSWEARLARRYYDKLFREYCIADLTRYKENKIALRWRTEAEVVTGKGQFQCGSRKCDDCEALRSWEVNFAYQENGERKNALVKVRLCPTHSEQLNFTSRKREVKRLKHMDKQQRRNRRKEEKTRREKKNDTNSSATSTTANTDAISDADANESLDNAIASEVDESNTAAAQSPLNKSNSQQQTPDMDDEDVWSRKPDLELEPTSRETDFERYLEDLLL